MIHPFLKMNDFGNFGHQHFLEMLHKIWQHFCMFILKKSNDFFANILRSGQPTSEARSGSQRQLHNCGARTDSGAAKSTPTRNACAETLDFENICLVCVNFLTRLKKIAILAFRVKTESYSCCEVGFLAQFFTCPPG